jgi:hypothetical protein
MSDNKKNSTKSGGLTSIGGGRGRTPEGPTGPVDNVVDFTTARSQRNQDNRRAVERFFLGRMVDVICEIGGKAEFPLELVEVSETGCSFRITNEKRHLLPYDTAGKPLPLNTRFYFSSDSYLKVGLNIVNVTADIADGHQSVRVGCQVDPAFASSEAYRQFVRFMDEFAQHCSRDTKQVSAF